MKKSMVPLLAIAFVVAMVSTGLFYGLFASRLGNASSDLPKQHVSLTQTALSSPNPNAGSSVPDGMRAVSLHVFESGGVLALIRTGSRVDIQAISDRSNGAGEGHTLLRTVLQNVEVLSVAPQPELVALRYSAPIVTVLVRPEESDLAAAADTGARIRLALRNCQDGGSGPHPTVATSSLFTSGPRALASAPGRAHPALALVTPSHQD